VIAIEQMDFFIDDGEFVTIMVTHNSEMENFTDRDIRVRAGNLVSDRAV